VKETALIPKQNTADDRLPASREPEDDSADDLPAAPDQDVPNEEVIEKTLPEPNPDKQPQQ
jgi:hypothetical protein